MNGFLLDTNCISELVRVRPAQPVISWLEGVDESLLYLSVLTLGEIRKGVAALPASKRRAHLESWLRVELQERFAGRILPIDLFIADRWGLLAAEAKLKGRALPIIDGLLAATAVHYDLTIVSRNTEDFENAHVRIVNPWQA